MNEIEMKQRTKEFSLRVIRLVGELEKQSKAVTRAIAGQLIRAGTSVGANYRAACRARSKAEFAAKLGIAEEEADECCYWLEIVIEAGLVKPPQVEPLLQEANEIVAIITASRKTVQKRM